MDRAEFSLTPLSVDRGDLLLLATDGITEARQGTEFLGYEGMTRIAQQSLFLGALEQLGQAIVQEARTFAGGVFQDDVCLLLVRRR